MNEATTRTIACRSLVVAFALLALTSGSCYSTGGFIEDRAAPDGAADATASVNTDGGGAASDGGASPKDATPAQDGTTLQDASADRGAGGQGGATSHDASTTGTGGSGAGGAAGSTPPPATGYTLVFSDEFDGAALDRTKWCTRYVYPGGPALQVADSACTGPNGSAGTLDYLNDEQQRYVDFNTKNETMHVVGGGTVTLRSTKSRSDSAAPYEAAMLRSKFEFKPTDATSYFVVAKMRLPNVVGTWPSLWLNGGYGTNGKTQWPPEIDIFEGALNGVEDTANMIRMGSQVRGLQTASQKQEITFSQNYNATWDDYYSTSSLRGAWVAIGAVWTSQAVCYFVNTTKTMCENYQWSDNAGTPANPASLLLNLAIGGSWAGRHGIDDTMFPTSFDVDYVHVYSFAGQTVPSPLPN